MKKAEKNYVVVIPAETHLYVKRVSDGSPVGRVLSGLVGGSLWYRSAGNGLLLVTGEGDRPDRPDGALNATATAVLGGAFVRGDAVLMRFGADDIEMYTKAEAQAVVQVLHNVM